MYYVLVDIGCIGCMEKVNVLGIFTNRDKPVQLAYKYYKLQKENGHVNHNFIIFKLDNLDKEIEISY